MNKFLDNAQKSQFKRSKFTREEDTLLGQLVQKYGVMNWNAIAHEMKTKNPRQCQEHWMNYLNPALNKNDWDQNEDNILIQHVMRFGCKWVTISKFLPNRTDSQCKNRFRQIQRKSKNINELMTEVKRFPLFSIQIEPDKDNSIQIPNENEKEQISIEENVIFEENFTFEEKEDFLFDEFEKDFFLLNVFLSIF
jgi:hypothetical protein